MAYIACMPAGRLKGSKDSYQRTRRPAEVLRECKRTGLSPLEYLLSVVNDPEVSVSRRDKCAIAAAKYEHAAARPAPMGKKAAAEHLAHAVPVDQRWRLLLRPSPVINAPWEADLKLPDLDWERLLDAPLPPLDPLPADDVDD
jgi:hypothetical protein